MPTLIRGYRSDDRPAVRKICCDAGFMGNPVDRLFSDRETFADFFTSYYTDFEPRNAIVAEYGGAVVGYILCCMHHRRFPWIQAWIVARSLPRIIFRMLSGKHNRNDWNFLRWFLVRSLRGTPSAPRQSAHFHINISAEHRNTGTGWRLFRYFLKHLEERGIENVYGQIQTFEDRRPDRVFERFGFRLFDRRTVTKFEPFGLGKVYVSTFTRAIQPH